MPKEDVEIDDGYQYNDYEIKGQMVKTAVDDIIKEIYIGKRIS